MDHAGSLTLAIASGAEGAGWYFILAGTFLLFLSLFGFDLLRIYGPFPLKWGAGFTILKWNAVTYSFAAVLLGVYDLHHREKLGPFSQSFEAFDRYFGEYLWPAFFLTGFILAGLDYYHHRQSLSIEEIENP